MPDGTWMHSVWRIWLCCVVMRIGYRIHLFTYRRLLSIRIGRYCIYDCYLDFFIHFLLSQTESYGDRPISRSLQTSSTIPTPR